LNCLYGFVSCFVSVFNQKELFMSEEHSVINRRQVVAAGIGLAVAASGFKVSAQNNTNRIVIYLYDGMTALDAIGAYEVLRFLPNAQLQFVAKTKGLITTDSKVLRLEATASIEEVSSADILLIPGGATTYTQMRDKNVVAWVQKIHNTTRWTTSVCTGSLLLAAAGILKGLKATTHWGSLLDLRGLGADAVNERVVQVGKIMTGAGVSASIDMALVLVALEAGDELAKAIQLAIEYDPNPPFDSGSVGKATAETRALARKLLIENARVAAT
jgi:putative intracellular protease/amidase